METVINIIKDGQDLKFCFRWMTGLGPEENQSLLLELESLPDTLVKQGFGQVSLVIDVGTRVQMVDVLELIRQYGYHSSNIPLSD